MHTFYHYTVTLKEPVVVEHTTKRHTWSSLLPDLLVGELWKLC